MENIQYTPLPYTFNFTWEAPRITKNCIKQYRIAGWATNDPTNSLYKFDESTKETTFLAKNLISCQEYTIQIIPEGQSKADGKPYQIHLEAMPTKEQAVALESKISTHSIELIVKSTDQTTLCPVLFVRFTCMAAFPDNDIPHKGAEIVEQALKTAVWSGTVQPLSPFTEYLCRGSIFNAGGWADSNERRLSTANYCEFLLLGFVGNTVYCIYFSSFRAKECYSFKYYSKVFELHLGHSSLSKRGNLYIQYGLRGLRTGLFPAE